MVSAEQFSMNGDQFLGRVYKNNDFDCQDFVEKTMKTVGITDNLPGSNAWYRKMTWVGTPRECIAKFGCIPKGALLFILKQDGKEPDKYKGDGIGNASHIGIKTGRTGEQMVKHAISQGVSNAAAYNYGSGAIHSSSSRGHVVTSNFADKEISGGWNRIGLWNKFSYGQKIDSILNGNQKKEEVVIIVGVAKVIGGTLNLRAEPSANSARLTGIPEGAKVNVLASDGTWSNVTYNGITGYVMSKYLKEEKGVSITLSQDNAIALYEALKASLGKE